MRNFVLLLAALGAASLSACSSSSSDSGTPANASDAGTTDAPTSDAPSGDAPSDGSPDDGSTLDASDDATADAGADAQPGDAASDAAGDGGSAPTFTEVKQTALSGCSGFGPMQCHTKSPFGGDLDLTDPNAYSSLVNVPSTTDPSVLRVKPGDPDNSMLIRKLTNQIAGDGSQGDPMPKGEGIMWSEPSYVPMVRDWILAGAPDN